MSNDVEYGSRLGRVLVNKGYITEAQLEGALKEQLQTGQRLGEVLVAQECISDTQLRTALKRQSLLRKVGTLATLVCAPLHAVTGFAATLGISPTAPINTRVEAMELIDETPTGMTLLSDNELREARATGPGIFGNQLLLDLGYDGVAAGQHNKYHDEDDEEDNQEEQIAYELMDTVTTFAGFGPMSGLLDADISIEGIRYVEGAKRFEVTDDGGLRIYMPVEIDRINIENLRVKGSDESSTFGSIFISDVKFDPGSNYTIRGVDARW